MEKWLKIFGIYRVYAKSTHGILSQKKPFGDPLMAPACQVLTYLERKLQD